MSLKSKTYAVTFAERVYLVQAITKAGASRDLLEHLAGQAKAELATGAQIYAAGVAGESIIGADKYALPLTGVPETESEESQA